MKAWIVGGTRGVVGASEGAGALSSRGLDLARRTHQGAKQSSKARGMHARTLKPLGPASPDRESVVLVVAKDAPLASRLSPRQREIAARAASGETAPEIAAALGLTPATVRSHLKRAYAALGVCSRAELVLALAGERA